MVQKAKGRVPTLPKQVNQSTDKVLNQLTCFNEVMWGKCWESYVKLAKNLSNSHFDEVVNLTVKCLKTTHHIIVNVKQIFTYIHLSKT